MEKAYISAGQLLSDALDLGLAIAESGFRPDLIVGIWRGGTPVAIAVQEVLEFVGIASDHIAIRTSSYAGIGERSDVRVHGLEYLVHNLSADQSLLIVDDVFDTGMSVDQVIRELQTVYGQNMPTCRTATPYFKPASNLSGRQPDYFLHTTDKWLVFPHELIGLSDEEILRYKPGMQEQAERLLALRNQVCDN